MWVRTELHFHLLPAVDDGPSTEREAIALARLAVEDGTRRVVCTPHVRELDLRELPARLARLRVLLASEQLPLEVFPGGEISPKDVAELRPADVELVAQGPQDARWLLLEVPLCHGDTSFQAAAADLRARGFGLVIGHPERGSAISLELLREHVRDGAILQINASSLAGLHGTRPQDTGFALARSGLPFIVSSDAHSLERPPLLSDAARRLAQAGVAPELVRAAIDIGPSRLFVEGLRPDATAAHAQLGVSAPRRAA